MKLSQLVYQRNLLEKQDIRTLKQSGLMDLSQILYLVDNFKVENPIKKLQDDYASISEAYDLFYSHFDDLKQKLNAMIREQEPEYYRLSSELYLEGRAYETPEYILHRILKVDTATAELYKSRVDMRADWRLPALIIRPGDEIWIRNLIAFDPLYIADTHKDLLIPCQQQFPEAYQRRMMTYVLDESKENITTDLPNDQFGLMFVYNFFNFKPLEIIKKYLTELFYKLRPGGVLVMTLNDCDHEHGVMLVENKYAPYTPLREVLAIANQVGYELVYRNSDLGTLTWLELGRPGKITSLRGGQTLAKIIDKPQ